MLNELSRAEILRCLAWAAATDGRLQLFKGLLQARLASLTSTPVKSQEELLKIPEVCRVLKITRPYAYELVREGRLRSVKIPGERGYVRVPRESLDRFIRENAQKEASFKGVDSANRLVLQ